MVLVDERERQANSNPLSIYLNLRKAIDEGVGVLGFECEVRRQTLALGDFGWALEGDDGELRVLPALVERKRIGDLVGRSAQGDHIEQLRRMGDHVGRSFLLLEGDPRFASGFTAFGLRDAQPGCAEDVVTEESDVLELCCTLLVDGQRICAKPLLCSQPTDTTRLLAQLTPMLQRAHKMTAGARLLTLDEARRKWKRSTASDASNSLERSLFRVGLNQAQMLRVAGRFGCETGLRTAYDACASQAARERLLCPLLEDASVGRCAAGDDALCCRLGKGVLASLLGADAAHGRGAEPKRGQQMRGVAAASSGSAGCIDLTDDLPPAASTPDAEKSDFSGEEMAQLSARLSGRTEVEGAAPAQPAMRSSAVEPTEERRCVLVLGSGLNKKAAFIKLLESEWPSEWKREAAAASQPPGAWLQLWASQGSASNGAHVSSLHTLHWSNAECLIQSMRHALLGLPSQQLAQLEVAAAKQHERDIHPALIDAACASAKHLIGGLPAPTDPLRQSCGRRQTHLLVISGIEKVRNGRAGLGNGDRQIERLLEQVAWPLAQATLLAIQVFDSARGESWVVMPAKNDNHVHMVVRGLVRACHRRALLGLQES